MTKNLYIVIVGLVVVILGLFVYILANGSNNGLQETTRKLEQYKKEKAARDSIIVALQIENDKIQEARKALSKELAAKQEQTQKQAQDLQRLFSYIQQLKQQSNETPNYSDSTTNAINDLLPK